jgi:hypothetical protein
MFLAGKDGTSVLRFHTLQSFEPVANQIFHQGDGVFLAKGSHQGTIGIFLGLTNDPKWADILEQDSQVRSHPIEWLQHASRN